eukprot:1156272-Pelagomonas_calceolata.AAC.14
MLDMNMNTYDIYAERNEVMRDSKKCVFNVTPLNNAVAVARVFHKLISVMGHETTNLCFYECKRSCCLMPQAAYQHRRCSPESGCCILLSKLFRDPTRIFEERPQL